MQVKTDDLLTLRNDWNELIVLATAKNYGRSPTICRRAPGTPHPYVPCKQPGGYACTAHFNGDQPYAGDYTYVANNAYGIPGSLPQVWAVGPFTVEFFCECNRTTGLAATTAQVGRYGYYDTLQLLAQFGFTPTIRIFLQDAGGSVALATASASLATGRHHFCAQSDGTTLVCYIDGIAGTPAARSSVTPDLTWPDQLYAFTRQVTTVDCDADNVIAQWRITKATVYPYSGFTPPDSLNATADSFLFLPTTEQSGDTVAETVSGSHLTSVNTPLPWRAF